MMERKKTKFSVNRVMTRVKDAQNQLKSLMKDGNWMEDARRYVERQRKEVQKLIHGDLEKLRDFLERERQGLEVLQKQIPTELNRWKKYLSSQRQELEQVLSALGVRKKVKKRAKKRPAKRPARQSKKKNVGQSSQTV
jgi:hypothetical protein